MLQIECAVADALELLEVAARLAEQATRSAEGEEDGAGRLRDPLSWLSLEVKWPRNPIWK